MIGLRIPLAAALGALLLLTACLAPPAPAVPDGVASVSSPIALSQDGRWLWVVNPDHGSVTRVDTLTSAAGAPRAVGREPWAVALTPAGVPVVLNRLDGTLTVLDTNGPTDIVLGAEPGGLALSPTGAYAYVTLSSAAEVVRVDLALGAIDARVSVGRAPWAIGVSDDGDLDDSDERVVLTHRFARTRPGGGEALDGGKEGWLTRLGADLSSATEIALSPYDFGYPNALEGLALLGDDAWVAHLLNGPELPRDFETTVSAGVTPVDLDGAAERAVDRIHLNESSFSTPINFPRSLTLSADGSRAYVPLAGTDALMTIDLEAAGGAVLIGFWPTGANPRGIVLSADGSRGYVMNYLSRDISVLDLADEARRIELERIVVAPETLSPQLLRGKTLFNNASLPQLSHLGWISCESCHPDGGSDQTSWFTPEGVRQTMPVWRLEGTAPFHISASRDEIADFENDIEDLMDGFGLAPGAVRRLLGDPNGGLSSDLDALAAFVLRGPRAPSAPPGDAAASTRGRQLFTDLGCHGCHGGPAWTVSALPGPVGTLAPGGELEVEGALVDVGTHNPSGDVLGASGFDIPTLLGLHATAPYLHDGSAATLGDVLTNDVHIGRNLGPDESADLIAFLRSIDDITPPVP
jgi:DNA-binding beta-propeller fold protein YncE/mono/diheme cytochrome c family protein